MEHFKDVLVKLVESPFLYLLTMFVLFVLLKKGLITIDTPAIKIGKTRSNERHILAQQISFINLHIDALAMEFIRKLPEIDKWHIKYTLNKIGDEFVRRASVNHISLDQIYLEDVYMTIVDMSRKRANHDYFYTKEFEDFVREQCKIIITHLIDIRNRMSK